MNRGFWGIGVYHPKKECNIGTLLRSAFLYNSNFIFTIGKRYQKQSSDTCNSFKHIPLFEYESFEEFYKSMPRESTLVGIELTANSKKLNLNYVHPERAVYLLGADDHGLPKKVIDKCQHCVIIDTERPVSMNLAVAGSIVMNDRYIKCKK